MTTKTLPFWKLDVVKTEKKLEKMAEDGLILSGFKGRRFSFKNGEPTKIRYAICRDQNGGGEVPKRLSEHRWEKVDTSKKHTILSNTATTDVPAPSTANWVSYYRKLQAFITCVIAFFVGFIYAEVSSLLNADPGKRMGFAVVIGCVSVLACFFVFLLLRIHHSNKKLLAVRSDTVKFKLTVPVENFVYTKEEEKAMRRAGTMKKKSKSLWLLSPDKTAEMIDRYAQEGWILYRMNRGGDCFYFVKGELCRVKFVMDFLHEITDEYISLTQEDGWKLEYTSAVHTDAFCMWSKIYAEGEPEPDIYTDKESQMEKVKTYYKKTMSSYLSSTIVFLLCSVGLACMKLFVFGDVIPFNILDVLFLVCCGYLAILYGILTIGTVCYYKRMKKKFQ